MSTTDDTPTVEPDREPEYVGVHSGIVAEECQNWSDAEPEAERNVPTKCGAEPTHTVVMYSGKIHEIAMCDDCGEPEQVLPFGPNREWTGK